MGRAAGHWWGALALLGCLACTWLAHRAISGDENGIPKWVLLALPLLALAGWAFARSARKLRWLLALLLAGAALYLLEERGHLGMVTAYGVPHAAANGFLLWWFGRTLRDGAEPLVTQVARRVHGMLKPEIEVYTRQVTNAWCVFFGAQIAVSLVLFLFARLEAWSLFVNVLNFPLVVLMFAGEYLVRVLLHPEHPRASIASTLRAFSAGAKAR